MSERRDGDGAVTDGDTAVTRGVARADVDADTAPAKKRRRPGSTRIPVLEPGTALGRYVVLETLGKGGMAVVYKAYDPELHRNLAVKLLRVDAIRGAIGEARARLLREAQALARLSHPNVIAIHDVGTRGDDVFIAMELVAGRTLRAWLRERRRPLRDVLDVLRAAGRGLAAAHAAGLVHRDFKPDNVMVGDDGRVRVLDFGLARRHEHDELTPTSAGATTTSDDLDSAELSATSDPTDLLDGPLTRVGLVIGTPAYMAPEQHRGKDTDARSDQFSFAVVLYEAIHGERPFEGKSREALAQATALGKVRDVPAGRRVPGWVRRIALRGLAPDPAARYPSMDALLADLARDPAARRRRVALGAGAVALVAIAAWALLRPRPSAAAPCQLGGGELDGAWDAAVRGRVARALGGGAAATRVAALLDGYADRWRAMRVEACRATRVFGAQSERALDLRMRCLERRRDQLGALTGVLATGDRDAAAHAVDAVFALPDLAACADVAALGAAIPPPDDARLRAKTDALEHRIDHAAALQQAGLVPAALREAQAAAAVAHGVAYAPAQARAWFRLGDIASDVGDTAAAEAALYDAARAASSAHDDHLVAEAYLDLAWVIGYQEARYADAALLTRVADAAIAHVGDDPMLRATYLHRIAILDHMQGHYADARARWEQALPLAERAYGRDHPRVADLLVSLGNVALAQGKLDEAGPFYERALAIYERALGPEHPRVTFALENLGALREQQDRYADALVYYQRSLALSERALGPDHPDVGHALFNVSNAQRWLHRIDDARASATRAVAIEERAHPDHPDLALALEALGEAELAAGDATSARAHLERALAMLTKSEGPDVIEVAKAMSALARVAWHDGRRAEACALRTRAAAIGEKAAPGDEHDLRQLRGDVAACAQAQRPYGTRSFRDR